MDFTKVVDDFAAYGFDDDGECRKKLASMVKNNTETLTPEQVKETILSELQILEQKINEHSQEELILLPESFDPKYNHWYCLHWILARHFINQNPPDFYLILTQIGNKREPNRMCSTVVDRMLISLV